MGNTQLHELIQFFILDNEPCVGFFEKDIEYKLNMTVYEFQTRLVNALKIIESHKK